MYPRKAASSVTPATMDCMTSSRNAVTRGMSGGVAIGADEGRLTRRAATASSASSALNPSAPAASDAPHTPLGSLLARRLARLPLMNPQYTHKYSTMGGIAHGNAV